MQERIHFQSGIGWEHNLIGPDSPILKAIEIIDKNPMKIAFVTDKYQKLLGTVTDGDIRRGLLRSVGADRPVSQIMNPNPLIIFNGQEKEQLIPILKANSIRYVPVLNENRIICGVEMLFEELIEPLAKENLVVLMAGGYGSRLRPLTEDCPKPMLKVGGKPILETILLNLIEYRFKKFFISVHYKSEQIRDYFGNGEKWGVEIEYLDETEKLGTAGALGLLPEKPRNPVLVINGDLLTKINFDQLLEFQSAQAAKAIMCVREYEFQVPYGVVKLDNQTIIDIEEKPTQKFFVNAGIYILTPDVISSINPGKQIDMPVLFHDLIGKGIHMAAFPIREYWLDIGKMDDFNKAMSDFGEHFLNF